MDAQETALQNLAAEAAKTNAVMVDLLTKQNEQVAKNGETTSALAAQIKQTGDDYIAAQAALNERLAKYDERLKEAEQKADRAALANRRPGWDGGEEEKSAGAAFADQFRGDEGRRLGEMLSKGNVRSSQRAEVKGGFRNAVARAFGRKSQLLTDASTRFTPVMRESMLPFQNRALTIRDLIDVVPTQENSGEYVEELGFTTSTAISVTSISQSGGTATLTKAAHGFRVGQKIKVVGADQDGYNLTSARVLTVTSGTLTYAVDSGTVSPATGTITAYNLSAAGAAAGTQEGTDKPEAKLIYELKTWTARTIAHWLAASKQVVSDLPGLQSMVDNRLVYGVLAKEEQQLLYGTGAGQQLQGIMTHSGVQTMTGSGKKLDVIRRAITKVALAEMQADGVILAPEDWEAVETAKGSDDHYMWALPSGPSPSAVWRLPVVVSTVMEPGDFLVGSFGQGGATLYDREQASVLLSYDHSDFFIKNMLALLGEERVGVAWHRPEAFVAGDFGTAV